MRTLLLSTALATTAVLGAVTSLTAEDQPMIENAQTALIFDLVVPEGWTRAEIGPLSRLQSPEGTINLWFGVVEGTDPSAAIAEAWAAAGETAPAPLQVTQAPARPGFSAATVLTYAPDGQTIRQAVTEERDGQLFITLMRGELAALDRRGAQVNIAVTSFLPADVVTADLAGITPDRLDAADLADLSAHVSEAFELFDVPGAVVAVVQDGEVRLLEGFGVRALGQTDPVTPETRMMIGSVGKTMTTLLMARLVEEGLLAWDDPVRRILPEFAVADPDLSQAITVRNLVCACSGVPRRDMEFIFNASSLDAEAVIGSLSGFEFFTGFGEAFQYSNQLVATGGWVAAAAAGATWGALDNGYFAAMQERIFSPIGMERTTFDLNEVMADGDHALPHAPHGSGVRRLLPVQTEQALMTVAPAGASWSTGADMARYLQTLIAGGITPEGEWLVSSGALDILTTPQVPVSATMSYGLGWFVEDWRGQRLIHHGGNTFGFTSDLAFLPEARAGIVIIANAGRANDFTRDVRERFLELLFDLDPVYREGAQIALDEAERQAAIMAAAAPVEDELAAAMEGRYVSASLGEVSVRREGGRLVFDIGEMAGEVRVDPNRPDRMVIWEGPLFTMPLVFDPESRRLTFGEGAAQYDFEVLPE
jgi:CubicO group peptidase (beta-lactamase class C family)